MEKCYKSGMACKKNRKMVYGREKNVEWKISSPKNGKKGQGVIVNDFYPTVFIFT